MAASSRAIFGLIGTGGHARETMAFASAFIETRPDLKIDGDRIVFVDRQPGPAIGGHAVMNEDGFIALDSPRHFAVAIGDGATRRVVAERLEVARCRPLSLIAPSATVAAGAAVAPGALIGPYGLVSPDVTIGRSFVCNAYASVAHDSVVGDFVTLGPRACVNGAVRIGDGVTIGAGALIKQGLTLGRGCVIGMGAVVIRDVPPGATVVGNPARVLTA